MGVNNIYAKLKRGRHKNTIANMHRVELPSFSLEVVKPVGIRPPNGSGGIE